MKLICAWCKKVIRDGPENPPSHGICPECARRVTTRNDPATCRLSPREGRMMGHLILAILIVLLWLLAVLCSEGLHFASGGKIPRFIQWEQPEPSQPEHPHHKRH
jgi:hypothetical protein